MLGRTAEVVTDEGIREKKRIARSSVLAAIFLTGFKLAVGLWTNSLGILSEAAHSGLDLLAAAITLVAVTYADRPPDDEHPYGHGKLENISAFVETLLLVVTCAWIIWEGVDRLVTPGIKVEANKWSFMVMATSIVIDISRSRALYRVARKHNSQALEADALHFSSDVWSSLTVILGLVFVWQGRPQFDAIAAIGVALLVLFVSYRLGRRTFDALMDRVPKGMPRKLEDVIRRVEGVEKLSSLRIRASGARLFVDTRVAVRRTIPFHGVHMIMDAIEKAIHDAQAHTDVVVHAEPVETNEETVVDKIQMIVMDRGLRAPHNLEVHLTDGTYFVDFDVEYKKGQTFIEAHQEAVEIERQIRKELPSIGKVTIHMEVYQPVERELTNVTEPESRFAAEILEMASSHPDVLECRDLTLLGEGPHFHATLTCILSSTKTLEEVHQILTEVETSLHRRFSQLHRVVIHAEPHFETP
jgi:cation diffusion facilitator family transporter